MELILKLPEGKPPFIGVLFDKAEEAELMNQDLVLQHKGRRFRIVLETLKQFVNLRLVCEEMVNVRFYNHLKYRPDELRSWLYIISANKASYVNFSQLCRQKEKLVVARTAQKNQQFVLKVQRCEVLAPV